jgi:hypothetical protein
MTQQEIQDRNKEIALMLGLHHDEEAVIFNMTAYTWDMLRFHSDWNWLMEAVTKVYSLITPTDSIKHDLIQKVGRVQKEAVFIAVSDFAKYWNFLQK